MNGGVSESQTGATFEESSYRVIVVAIEFQTGLDEPPLTAILVDKRLDSFRTVQTPSLPNRSPPPRPLPSTWASPRQSDPDLVSTRSAARSDRVAAQRTPPSSVGW